MTFEKQAPGPRNRETSLGAPNYASMKTGRSTSEKSTAPMGRNFLGHDIDTYHVSPFILTKAQFLTFLNVKKKFLVSVFKNTLTRNFPRKTVMFVKIYYSQMKDLLKKSNFDCAPGKCMN